MFYRYLVGTYQLAKPLLLKKNRYYLIDQSPKQGGLEVQRALAFARTFVFRIPDLSTGLQERPVGFYRHIYELKRRLLDERLAVRRRHTKKDTEGKER